MHIPAHFSSIYHGRYLPGYFIPVQVLKTESQIKRTPAAILSSGQGADVPATTSDQVSLFSKTSATPWSRSKHNTTTRYRYYQHYPPPMLNQCSVHIEQTKLCLPVMISSSVSVYYFVASSCSSIWCPCNHCLGSVWNSAKTTIWNTRSTIKP